jgi:polysaccharide export outer membrane protein
VGEVRKPGGYLLKSNENISVLQAIALAEGLTHTSAKDSMRIIRTDPETGQRSELPVRLGAVLSGKAPDPMLRARDIVFVPNSGARSAMLRGAEAAVSIVSGLVIFRR